jgi:two-component system sensor histidine kinase/response regulator
MTTPTSDNLLIVDDEAPHLKALCETLSAQGYLTTGFTSPKDALSALRKQPFDLVLTDLMMPEMDGIAFLKAALEINPDIVGIVMTGHGTIDTAVSAMKLGALDYILKPFKLSVILPVLSRALVVRRLRLENAVLQQRLQARTLELEAANKELESFSYSVSHDLRAPLRTIDGFTHALIEDLGENLAPPQRTCADHIRSGVARMNALIDDLLRLARTTQSEVHGCPLDLSKLARDIAEKLQAGDKTRNAEWIIAPNLTATADRGLLHVALENLLSNAWKYTAKVPLARIAIGAEMQPDGTPMFYVRDNGAGFDMKYADKLFGTFQRLHSERDFPGTGVGLATVQRIIHKHGGRIWAQAAPDEGATFYFTLPSATGHATSVSADTR